MKDQRGMAGRSGSGIGWLVPSIVAAVIGGLVGGGAVYGLMGSSGPDRSVANRIAVLDQRIAQQSDEIRQLTEQLNQMQNRIGMDRVSGPYVDEAEGSEQTAEVPERRFDGYADLMLLSARRRTNQQLRTIPQSRLVQIFGRPAEALGQDCQPPTSPRLVKALAVRDVGPFRARLVRPAVDSLERIFAKVLEEEPALYRNLKTYGGLCARLIRGSEERISRHAFGMAIDVSVGGTIDAMGDGKTQFGLILLAEYFQEEGWLWGAAFGREDSMHFEVSKDLFETWLEQGLI